MKNKVALNRISLAMLCCVAVIFGGCAKPAAQQIPNPLVEVDSPQSFVDELGLRLAPPPSAENITYNIIGDTIAQIEFTRNGDEYCLRAATGDDEIHGVYEEFEEAETSANVEYPLGDYTVRLRTTLSGGKLATWNGDGNTYSLYTAQAVDDEDMIDLSLAVIESSLSFVAD